jgi:predicted ATPase
LTPPGFAAPRSAESFFNVATLIDEVGAAGSYGGKSLHHQSHGESFLALVEHRFGNDGLFLLDEPKAALSPQRQLTFLARVHVLLSQGGQFIVVTHSPILLAYPEATIYRFDDEGISACAYDDLEHVHVTRDFCG